MTDKLVGNLYVGEVTVDEIGITEDKVIVEQKLISVPKEVEESINSMAERMIDDLDLDTIVQKSIDESSSKCSEVVSEMSIFDEDYHACLQDNIILERFLDNLYEARGRLVKIIKETSMIVNSSVDTISKEFNTREKHTFKYLSSKLNAANSLYDSISLIHHKIKTSDARFMVDEFFINEAGRMSIAFASTNPNKVEEFISYSEYNDVFAAIGILFDIKKCEVMPEDVDEGIVSFNQNAKLKSNAYSLKNPGVFYISEDSGINLVDVSYSLQEDLNMMVPGVVSARFNKPSIQKEISSIFDLYELTYPKAFLTANAEALGVKESELNNIIVSSILMENYDKVDNIAMLNTFSSISLNGINLASGVGSLSGRITLDYKNDNLNQKTFYQGFGYNPILWLEDFSMYLEEISTKVRVDFDHRSQSFNNSFVKLFEYIAFK